MLKTKNKTNESKEDKTSKRKKLDPVERELLQKKRLAEVKKNMDEFINTSNTQVNLYVQKAREYKEKGLESQAVQYAKRAKFIIAQQQKVEDMKFQFEMGQMMTGMNEMMANFMESISSFADTLSANEIKDKHLYKAMAKFQKSQMTLSRQTEIMDNFFEESDDLMSDMLGVEQKMSSKEFSDILGGNLGTNQSTVTQSTSSVQDTDDLDAILDSLKR